MNITQLVFPCTITVNSQFTSCWSALRQMRKTCSTVQCIMNKQQICKTLHTDCRWSYRSSHWFQNGTFTSLRGQSVSLFSSVSTTPLRKSPTCLPRSMSISTRWYVRDRDSTNKTHANKTFKDVMPLTTRRVVRSKKSQGKESTVDAKELYDVSAYATSEEYDLEGLSEALVKQGLYSMVKMPTDVEDAMCAEANYRLDDEPREIFFFRTTVSPSSGSRVKKTAESNRNVTKNREGCTVFWNMPVEEREAVLRFIQPHQCDSYDSSLVQQEFEHIDFTYTEHPTRLAGEEIQLERRENGTYGERQLEKYAFSNGLALSVKLAIWEASMARFVDSVEYVLEDLKAGRKVRISRAKVLQKTGELFNLRHLVNLSSDLLDTPDFYWDRETLEPLYTRTCNHLTIARRTKVINQKLAHCCDLMDLLRDHLNDKHSSRLEWIIIILILVEVVFEVIRMVEKYTAS